MYINRLVRIEVAGWFNKNVPMNFARYIAGHIRRGILQAAVIHSLPGRLRMDGTVQKLLLSIPEFMTATGLGRTKIYELIGNGAIESVTVGRRRLIPTAAAHDWVERLRRKCSGRI